MAVIDGELYDLTGVEPVATARYIDASEGDDAQTAPVLEMDLFYLPRTVDGEKRKFALRTTTKRPTGSIDAATGRMVFEREVEVDSRLSENQVLGWAERYGADVSGLARYITKKPVKALDLQAE
jgi:hypothetical protein